ncbi:threonylcarbamoyl-AMP synthase [bacterium]|nr:threonylcarbamoyl-AMP synthase [bacterium]
MKIINIKDAKTDFIVSELKKGKIFFVPTDTCYGILGNVKKSTIDRIFNIKRRPRGKSLPLFVSKKWVYNFVESSANFKKLIRNFWPGALTISVLPKSSKINFLKIVTNNNGTIAVREPDFLFLNKIINKYGEPLTSTSANITKMDACYSTEELVKQFIRRKFKPDYIIDSGRLPKRKSSSIIDSYTLDLIREGEITRHVVIKKIK